MLNKLQKAILNTKYNLLNHQKINRLYQYLQNDYKSEKVNLGQIQAEGNRSKKNIKSFEAVEFQVFSQFGDDGIIQWLIHQLPVPNKTFVEFGVENYREANTRFLLINNYWSGLVIDGSEENVNSIKADQVHTFYDLQAVCSFITSDNINELIRSARFQKQVGILSVDLDGNDYWVLKAINCIEPIIIICEYNSLFGFEYACTIPYSDNFVRGTKFPFQFYGTSLKALYSLAKEKGYSLVGCNSAGNNAYFIKNDYTQHLPITEKLPEEAYNFASFTEAYDKGTGEWLRGSDKIMSINNLPIYNTETDRIEKLDASTILQSLKNANKLNRY